MGIINLSNIKVNDNEIQLEFLYKNQNIFKGTSIYLENEFKVKKECIIKKSNNRINFTYNNENLEVAKVLVTLSKEDIGFWKIILEDKNGARKLNIRNNKSEIITKPKNPYIIFLDRYKMQILEEGFKLSVRKIGDKLKYQIKKQKYGIKKYKRFFFFRYLKSKNRKYYLFNDRLLYGDDNAEQLFKYVNEKHPHFAKKCYFILDKKSTCKDRIKNIGKVLIYGSFRHKLKFLNSRIVLSSHSSYLGNCFNPFSEEEMDVYKDIINKKFVFLQHGVIMNDVREYLNRELTTADLFITSTKKEFEYINSEDFMYEKENVVPTGLPRFDRLINNIEKIILISPTWRNLGEDIKFKDSKYYLTFKKLLSNKKLLELLSKNNYKIKFLLHPVFTEYKGLFEELANENIEILETKNIKYFELFNECTLFITDYSSIHYDVATLKKPIIYYQFDKEYFFKKQ